MKTIELTKEEFFGNNEYEGIIFPNEEVQEGEEIFYKNFGDRGMGFIVNNSFSHSNGNFPFWSNGERVEFKEVEKGYIQRIV